MIRVTRANRANQNRRHQGNSSMRSSVCSSVEFDPLMPCLATSPAPPLTLAWSPYSLTRPAALLSKKATRRLSCDACWARRARTQQKAQLRARQANKCSSLSHPKYRSWSRCASRLLMKASSLGFGASALRHPLLYPNPGLHSAAQLSSFCHFLRVGLQQPAQQEPVCRLACL